MIKPIVRRVQRFIFQPLTLMSALLLVGSVAFILFFNQSKERERQDFIRYSEALVASFFNQMQAELISMAKDYAHGDDIASHMYYKTADRRWFATYVNSAVYHLLRIDYFAVLTAEGAPVYAIQQGVQDNITDLAQWSPQLKKRIAEQVQRPDFEQENGVLKIGDQYYFVVVECIQPIDYPRFPEHTRFGYMLLLRPFSAASLQEGMKELVVSELRIAPKVKRHTWEGVYPLLGLDDRPVSYLHWRVNLPSLELQKLLRPKVLLTLAVLAVLAVLITLYMLAIQKSLQRAKGRMTRHSDALQKLVSYKATLEGQEEVFLRMVTEAVAQVLQREEVAVIWFEQKTLRLSCLDQYQLSQNQHSQTFYSNASEAYNNWLQVQAAYRDSDSRIHAFPTKQVSTTILLHGEPVGMLTISEHGVPLEQDERNFLCSVADLIALSMETGLRIRVEAALHKSEYFDATTGLPNRLSFIEFLQQQIEQNTTTSFAVVTIGLAGLRAMHDDLGHQQTEIFLDNLAEHLRTYRANDLALSRLDTYRFALFWQPEQDDNITQVLQNMQHALSIPMAVGEHLIHPKIRMGVSVFPHDAQTAETLLQRAEFALGRAQKNGSEPLIFFDEALNQQVKAYYQLEQDMRDDIGSTAFEVLLQPLVELKSNRVVGAEALLRWQHAEQGYISPVDFIPLAEETGLIQVLWQQVLAEVLKFLVRRQDQLPEQFVIALNVSSVQLRQIGFIDYLIEALASHGILASRLEIELTESVSLDLYHNAPEMLDTLRRAGIRIAVDDFGTGYSSLSYLHDLQIDKLKIDKKFIDDMLTNEKNESLVKMMLSLARSLNLEVVAEGIETKAQADFLRQHDCKIGQGYYFAKPMSISDFEHYLAL